MKFTEVYVDRFENRTGDFVDLHERIRVGPGSRIFRSTIKGPLYLNRNSQFGPDVVAGKYTGMNESCYIARGTIGAYCSIGARTAINPFNHPTPIHPTGLPSIETLPGCNDPQTCSVRPPSVMTCGQGIT
jgi:hypothetical protein